MRLKKRRRRAKVQKCRSGRGSKSLAASPLQSGLASHLSPSPLLLHHRPPPRPGRRGGAPPQPIHPPAPPSHDHSTTSAIHHQHSQHPVPPSPPSTSATPPIHLSLLLPLATHVLDQPLGSPTSDLPRASNCCCFPPRPYCCYSTSSAPLLLL